MAQVSDTSEDAKPKPELPSTSVERALAQMWSALLGQEHVGIHDDFFALGGNDELAAELAAEIGEVFQVQFSARSLADAPTVAGLAAVIEKERAASSRRTMPPMQPAPRNVPVRLSFSQERIWFIHQLDPNSTAYNMGTAVRLTGRLDAAALKKSFDEIVRRHESLRTIFTVVNGQPVQVVAPASDLAWSLVDLRELPESQREDRALQLASEEVRRPFDLERGPLFRLLLLRLCEEDHFVVLNMHHIISDAWSVGVMQNELLSLYPAFLAGASPSLPDLPIQYVDFAHWQREWLKDEALEAQLTYWRRQLAGAKVLELPTDHPRPAFQTYRGDYIGFDLPGSLFDALERLSRQEGVTLFMTLLAAFQILLYRYTNQEDVAIGVPIANRTRLTVEGLIGTFVNTLVMRTDLSGAPTFRELLARVRQVALDAYTHQDLSFAKLVAELQPERDTSHSPFFQVMFNVINVPVPEMNLPGITIKPLYLDRKAAQFDLTFTVVTIPNFHRVTIDYNTDLFNTDTIARMASQFETLLRSITVHPDQTIAQLPILPDDEKHKLLVEWNNTDRAYPHERGVHQLFHEQVERTPNAIAAVGDALPSSREEQLTYRELDQRANQLAHYLQNLGVGPEVCVGISMHRTLDMLVAALGVLKAGGAYLPLDPAFPTERLDFMIQDSQLPVLITQARLLARLPDHCARIVCLDADWTKIAQESRDAPASHVTSDNLAYVLYTSGSTGKPKGVQVPHRALTNFLSAMRREPGLTDQDILLSVTTLSFDIAGLELYLPLITGGQVVIVSREIAADGPQLAQQIARHGATAMQATPATWRMLLDSGWSGDSRLKILCGGEALPRDLADQLLDRCDSLWNMYGPTETTVWSTVQRIERNKPITIGRPIANTRIYILDSRLEPVPIGVPGDLYIGGDGLARGYLNRPDLTAERFLPDPFSDASGARMYMTGDAARYLADGSIDYLGRSDQQVKVRGFRIELGEVEAILAQHPAVQQAVVTAREDLLGEKRLVAYVSVQPDQSPSTGELRAFLKERLPDYMVPSAIVSLASFPLTPNGKVDRRALPEPTLVPSIALEKDFRAPRDRVERELVAIWEQVLNIRPISIRSNFFDLGGHSLLAIRAFAQIDQALGKKLPIATIFQAPTIEQLAQVIRQNDFAAYASTLVPMQPNGSRPPFFCVHGFGGSVIGYTDLVRLLGSDQPVYGLQARGLEGGEEPHTRIEEMAAYYIKAMQAVQPDGPYFLGGYCFGGVVAFEMARQLQGLGQSVARLVVFEGYALNRSEAKRHLLYPRATLRFVQNLPFWMKDNLEQQFEWVLARLRRARRIQPDERRDWNGVDDISDLLGPRQVREAHLQAIQTYQPRVYRGQVTLFRVRALSLFRAYDPEMGWGKLAAGGVDIKMVPGAHYNLLQKPYVVAVAAALKSILVQAQRDCHAECSEASRSR